jgi:hypothetical protein
VVLTSLESVSVKTAESTTAHREAAAGCTILKKNANPVPFNGRRGRPKTGGKRFEAIQEMKQDAAKKKQRRWGEQQEQVTNKAAPIVATIGSTGPFTITDV